MILKLIHLYEEIMVVVVQIWIETLLAQCRLCPRQLLIVVRGEGKVVFAGMEDVVQRHRSAIAIGHRVVLGGRHVLQALYL